MEERYMILPLLIEVKKTQNHTITSREIAERIHVSQQSANRHLKLAVEHGYLVRYGSFGNRYSYQLTDKAFNWLNRIRQEIIY